MKELLASLLVCGLVALHALCPPSAQAACTAPIMRSGARKRSSLQSTSDSISARSARSQSCANVNSSFSSWRTLWIIHSPMMFFR